MAPSRATDALLDALGGWPDGDLALACSGGADSMLLLDVAAASAARHRRRVRVLHVDHGLNAASAQWAARVAECAEARGLACTTLKVAVPRSGGLGLEGAARHARYTALGAALAPGEILLTAHHAGDQAETVLLRLMRGAGIDGLGAIRPWRAFADGFLARPWLALDPAAIQTEAIARGLAFIRDPSNDDLHHDRNYLRHTVLPALAARWPHALDAIGRSAAQLAQAGARLATSEHADLAAITHPSLPGALSLPALAALPPATRAALLRRTCIERGIEPPGRVAIAEIERQCTQRRADAQIEVGWGEACARVWRDGLFFGARQLHTAPAIDLVWDGLAPLTLPEPYGELALEPPLALALRVTSRSGDGSILLDRKRPRQRLRSALQTAGVPPWERTRAPWLWHGEQLWAVGDWLLAAPFSELLDARDARWIWRRPMPHFPKLKPA